MSRIGKKPVPVPAGVTANVAGQTRQGQGREGRALLHRARRRLGRARERRDRGSAAFADASARARSGARRAPASPIWSTGVTNGFEKKLEINGVGYKAAVTGKVLKLSLGYSHDIDYRDPGRGRDRHAEADRNRHHRHRQAGGRPDRRRDPRLSRARALQGQGRQVRRRIHLPQGREEEVRTRAMSKQTENTARRKARVRRAIKAVANGRARLSVHRTGKQIYAQVIDDAKGVTLASASTLDKDIRGDIKTGANVEAAADDRQAHRRACRQGRREGRGLRPRLLHVSRPRQGAGRCSPRGRPELLTSTIRFPLDAAERRGPSIETVVHQERSSERRESIMAREPA